jgi:BolA protein
MGVVAEAIRSKLQAAFSPQRLEVIDASERHRGHGGWREGGESHFDVVIVADAFQGQGLVQRQRQVNRVLAEELAGPVHALSIQARAPGER